MNGYLGVLYQDGIQIGGFKNWIIQCELNPTQGGSRWATYQSTWKAWGKAPFFLETPKENIFDAKFYTIINGYLVEVYNEKVKAVLPNTFPLNEYLAFKITMEKA